MIASFLFKARNILLRIEKRDLYKCIGSTILKKPREKVIIIIRNDDMLTYHPVMTSWGKTLGEGRGGGFCSKITLLGITYQISRDDQELRNNFNFSLLPLTTYQPLISWSLNQFKLSVPCEVQEYTWDTHPGLQAGSSLSHMIEQRRAKRSGEKESGKEVTENV